MMEFLIPVEIIALLEEPNLQTPVILLQSRQPNKVLPIWIGHPEARAIAVILQNVKTDRPLTHDLLAATMQVLGGKISKVVIERMESHTFFATIYVNAGATGTKKIKIDARPSDAIALALKTRVPIFVQKDLLEKEGQENPFEKGIPAAQHPDQQDRPHEPIQPKKEFTPEELQKITGLLKEAQKREQQGS